MSCGPIIGTLLLAGAIFVAALVEQPVQTQDVARFEAGRPLQTELGVEEGTVRFDRRRAQRHRDSLGRSQSIKRIPIPPNSYSASLV